MAMTGAGHDWKRICMVFVVCMHACVPVLRVPTEPELSAVVRAVPTQGQTLIRPGDLKGRPDLIALML